MTNVFSLPIVIGSDFDGLSDDDALVTGYAGVNSPWRGFGGQRTKNNDK